MSSIRLNLGHGGVAGSLLVLGGARSGKSRFAENAITALSGPWIYLATGRAFDDEMRARIAQHKRERGKVGWQTVEEPLNVAEVLQQHSNIPVLLDCLTLWLTNLLLDGQDVEGPTQSLLASLNMRSAPTVMVGNEVGLGIVPQSPLGRRFRDEAGRLHQRLAAHVGKVVFVAAGLPMVLKNDGFSQEC
ncbi:bifunctional adenosylcobinamide kinase/adenosylcobinamide-phosphate guanylyltransferase [Acetobacter lambici]|uniref:Bifunctional adenosylcobalamin biosynthesis protein n=1 Tax=Acetobacter lambici TaxID=1332824 RepID=A0ABT1F1P4_9PROT|nr:bifunctional adenosylcobinamide kinase/adenosylcobinamide-phosphate guanylyltransferase [Acetobacter lambici]MCP1242993.1 bifunctional adenosylcobinamide kinase/adenosylcobinamide-phosphate guanylyltransferase [Acetobacter lambici]MCP1259137.1 bifunctional adenosylcobinamide kinase/adenosylcobinamide-phosphate guanylyltransferase [Acetobacter lambici]NHO57369.1 bifunctional adenosylcobinamide kinase/adenosylcobinamide-phosphate guanylyltransferase [Acetobacter lambici]